MFFSKIRLELEGIKPQVIRKLNVLEIQVSKDQKEFIGRKS